MFVAQKELWGSRALPGIHRAGCQKGPAGTPKHVRSCWEVTSSGESWLGLEGFARTGSGPASVSRIPSFVLIVGFNHMN